MSIPIHSKPDSEKATITFEASGEALTMVARMLKLMAHLGDIGAGRLLGVKEDSEYEEFNTYLDGDGADKLRDVKINGKPLKTFVGDWPKEKA